MIVTRVEAGLRLVRQVDHQDQCALVADAWGNSEFERPAHFDAIRLAAAIHDEGWREWEGTPDITRDGIPVDFPQIDRPTHLALYRRAIERACALDPRAGLLVSLHGRGLYEKRLGLDGAPTTLNLRTPAEREFILREVDRQEELARVLGMDTPLNEWSWAAYRLLQAWDQLSLYLVWTGLASGEGSALIRVPRTTDDRDGLSVVLTPVDGFSCTIHPWPFSSKTVVVPVACRMIKDRSYRDREDLTATLNAATWETVRFTVRAA